MSGTILHWMYPRLCIRCESSMPERYTLCPTCLDGLETPSESDITEKLTRFPGPIPIGPYMALWQFDNGGTVQELQHRLKYGNAPFLGLELGHIMADLWVSRGYILPDLITAVPVTKKRFLTRGYNQSYLLASGMANRLGVRSHEHVLNRTFQTGSQTTLDRDARWQNVSGVFELDLSVNLQGVTRILLVDDVLTTGATLVSAAQTLIRSGIDVGIATMAFVR